MTGNRTLNPLLQRINKVVGQYVRQNRNKIVTSHRIAAFYSTEKTHLRTYKALENGTRVTFFSPFLTVRQFTRYHLGRAFLSTSATAKIPKNIKSDLEDEEENEQHMDRFEECPQALSSNVDSEGGAQEEKSAQGVFQSSISDSCDRVSAASVLVDAGKAKVLNTQSQKKTSNEVGEQMKRTVDNSKATTSSKRKERLNASTPSHDSKTSSLSMHSANENETNAKNSVTSQTPSPRQSKNISSSISAVNGSRSMLSVPSRSSKRCFYVPVFNPLPAMKDKTLAILDYKLWSLKDCNEFDEKVSQTETKLPPSTFVTTEARGVNLYSLDDVLDSIPSNPIHELSTLVVDTHLDNIDLEFSFHKADTYKQEDQKGDKRHTIKVKSRRK